MSFQLWPSLLDYGLNLQRQIPFFCFRLSLFQNKEGHLIKKNQTIGPFCLLCCPWPVFHAFHELNGKKRPKFKHKNNRLCWSIIHFVVTKIIYRLICCSCRDMFWDRSSSLVCLCSVYPVMQLQLKRYLPS
jgi:hypothetical protein